MEMLCDEPNETMAVITVDTKHRLLGASVVARGTLSEVHCEPRQILAPALRANAAAVIPADNHPSGGPTPSAPDIAITPRVVEVGRVLGMGVLDHVVVAPDWTHATLRGLGRDFGDD